MKLLIKMLLICCMFLSSAAYTAEQKQTIDVRVIIDVSGSMKKNDPDNLRIPALKLLIGLLPEGVKAGVWTFGTNVKPLIKHGVVNKQWKQAANKAVYKITSNDLYTNIEKALTTVAQDWKSSDPNAKRNIILLTDGMIDISKKSEKNALSRNHVIEKVLPGLRAAGVAVNTVSLSDNADLELNDALAIGTEGWSELVNNAEQLQRVFLHMFEKSAPRDTVPLSDNEFTIDKMIKEFTLLVFKQNEDKETSIIPPKGESFTRATQPKGIAWLEETGYDMVTIQNPTPGVWKINADLDPDNRVMVVTKLKLHTKGLPDSIFIGETYDLQAWVTAADKTIEKETFYELVDVKLIQHMGDDVHEVWELNQRDSQNRFIQKIGDDVVEGKVQFTVVVDGKTFKREQQQTVNVYENIIDVTVKDLNVPGSQPAKVIHIKAREDLIDAKTLNIFANISMPDGQEKRKPAKRALLGHEWLITIKDPVEGQYKVVLDVTANAISGREIVFQSAPLLIGDAINIAEEFNDEVEESLVEVEEVEEKIDWVKLGIYLVAGNILIFTFIGGIWFFLKKRKRKEINVEDDL